MLHCREHVPNLLIIQCPCAPVVLFVVKKGFGTQGNHWGAVEIE